MAFILLILQAADLAGVMIQLSDILGILQQSPNVFLQGCASKE
ncbi:MAG: hypothetical protein ACI9FJ_002071, partial [Alteromonadaceae bacterium]